MRSSSCRCQLQPALIICAQDSARAARAESGPAAAAGPLAVCRTRALSREESFDL